MGIGGINIQGESDKVVPEGEALSSAMTWAENLAEKAPMAMAITKRDLRHASKSTLEENTIFEAREQKAALESQDFSEGVSAFMEKRKPIFTGK